MTPAERSVEEEGSTVFVRHGRTGGKFEMKYLAVIVFFFLVSPPVCVAEELHEKQQVHPEEIIFKLERLLDKEVAAIQNYLSEIEKCVAAAESSENIIRKARAQGNIRAEQIAHSALATAQGAKQKNKELKSLAELNRKRVASALEYAKKGGAEPEARFEQVQYDHMNERWVQNQKHLIEQRLKEPNPYASEIYRSLKTKAPPPPPDRKYDNLRPGDVLLFSPDDTKSFLIKLSDRLSSASDSTAYHTVLYLKEVNGKKLFLDNRPGRGSHVISEEEFLRTYGRSEALVASASVAQPLRKDEAENLWNAAREAVMKESLIQQKKAGNIFDQTGYGLYGDDNMVCSETSRWALLKAGRHIPGSVSPLKRLLGIHYGPANFFSDGHNFIITPLWAPDEK
jgi:hypothetical protein